MREYEIVYIFKSNFSPEEIEAKLDRYHGMLTADGGGEITAVEQWGKRQLAYPIQKQTTGYYVVTQFTGDPATLPQLERVLRLEEDLLRYLIVLSEGELPIPDSMHEELERGASRERSRDDDDENGDDDDDDDDRGSKRKPAKRAVSAPAAADDDDGDDEGDAADGDDDGGDEAADEPAEKEE